MGIVRYKINESPYIISNPSLGQEIEWDDVKFDPAVFAWYKGKLYYSEEILDRRDTTNPENHRWYGNKDQRGLVHYELIPKDSAGNKPGRFDMDYPGRMWKALKIISFWKHPSKEELPKYLKELEKASGVKILGDPNWYIDIYTREDTFFPGNKNWDLVPIDKYVGSKEVDPKKLALQHVQSPMMKPNTSGPGKMKSKTRPLKWRQAMYAESLQEQALNEKLLVGEPLTLPELKKLLYKKVINFEFIKLDGEVRPAKGTTMPKYIPKDKQPTGDNPSSDKVAAFYDLSKGEWRSVSNRSDEIVIKRDPETGKPKVVVTDKKPKEEPTKPQYPKEKDVEKRPIIPKTEPLVKPTQKPKKAMPIPAIDKLDIEEPEDENKKIIDTDDITISADSIDPDNIEVPDEKPETKFNIDDITFPEEEEEETTEKSQEYKDDSVSEKKPDIKDITFPPDEEDITFTET